MKGLHCLLIRRLLTATTAPYVCEWKTLSHSPYMKLKESANLNSVMVTGTLSQDKPVSVVCMASLS